MKNITRLAIACVGLICSLQGHAQFTTSGSNLYHNNGNVGIGTSSPTAYLNIQSGSGSKGLVLDLNSSPGGNNTPYLIWDARNGGANYLFGMRQVGDKFQMHRYSSFWSGSLELFSIQGSNGYIGIGTSNPIGKLHIQDGTQSVRFLSGTNSSGYRLDLGVNDDGVNFYNNSSSRGYNFKNASNSNLLRLTSDGKVGLGTSAPDNKLHVEGDMLLDVYNNSGHEKGIFFREGFSTTNKYNLSIMAYDHNGAGSSPDGLSLNGYDGVSFSTGSNSRNERMRIAGDGNVGIGTDQPTDKLSVNGHLKLESQNPFIRFKDTSGSTYEAQWRFKDNKLEYVWGGGIKHTFETSAFVIGDYLNGENEVKLSSTGNSWLNGGNVGIGTSTPNNKLEVNGTIRSKKVKVEGSPWPDYVFEPGYDLKPLGEVEAYIKANKHLPEVPSAKDVEEKGLDLGSMDATLLKKVEEMTLYLIEMKKENEAMNKKMEAMQKELDKLKKKDN